MAQGSGENEGGGMISALLLSLAAAAPPPAAEARWTRGAQAPAAHAEQWAMDTIVFLPPAASYPVDFVRQSATMDQVAAYLDQQGIKFLRGPTTLVPDYYPPRMIEQIRALPAHHPFALGSNGAVVVHAIVSTTQAPTGTQK
jgi:hypothetical protein